MPASIVSGRFLFGWGVIGDEVDPVSVRDLLEGDVVQRRRWRWRENHKRTDDREV
jgi:hypothetical protein